MPRTTLTKLDHDKTLEADPPLNIDTACRYLGVARSTLNNLIYSDPTFPVHRLGNGPRAHRRFYRSEIDNWLRNRNNGQNG